MAKRKKPSTEAQTQEAIDKEMELLKRELKAYGMAATPTITLPRLRDIVAQLRKERADKPPCFRRSYSDVATQCKLCDLRFDCGGDEASHQQQEGQQQIEPCTKCNFGTLQVELKDDDGNVVDYGCTSEFCTNTMSAQYGYQNPKLQPNEMGEIGRGKQVVTVEIQKTNQVELERAILLQIEKLGHVRTVQGLASLIHVRKGEVARVLKDLRKRGIVTLVKRLGYKLTEAYQDTVS
jgi:hypothetical protein